MKKIIAMLLALVMLLSLAACASSGKTDAPAAADTAAPAETTDTTDTAPAADTKTDGKTYKVAMICDSSINDGGWGAACYNAMVAAAEKNARRVRQAGDMYAPLSGGRSGPGGEAPPGPWRS